MASDSEHPEPHEPQAGRPARFGLVVAALILAEITSAFEVSMIFAAMPRFVRVFGDPLAAGWILTSCLLVSAVAAALCARLGDLYGRRRVLLIVLAVCALGSLTSALSTSLAGVVTGTAIQGLSGAILPLCLGLASERLPRERVPLVVGIIVGAALTGGGGGLLLGGWLVDRFDWHAIFYCSASFAVLGAVAVTLWIPPLRHRVRRLQTDMVRGVLFAPGIVLVMYAVGQARTWGFGDPRILALLAAGVLILAYWARHQWRQENPLIDVRLMRVPAVAGAYACMACAGLGAFQFGYVLSLYLQQPVEYGGLGLSATATGAILGPVLWSGLVGGPLSGKISARYGARLAAMAGTAMLTAGWSLLAVERGSLWVVGAAAVLLGLGLPIVYAAVPTLIIDNAPADRVSEATGVNSVVRAIFQAIGAALVAILLSIDTLATPDGGARYPSSLSFGLTFGYVALISGVGLLVVAMTGRPSRQGRVPVPP